MSHTRRLALSALLTLLVLGSALLVLNFRGAQIKANNRAAALPALQGTAAVEQLKQQGLYASLNEAMTAAQYGVKPVPEAQRERHGSAYVAHNSAQQLRASFAAEGVVLQPATAGQGWHLEVKLRSAGYGEQQRAVGSGAFNAQGNRIEYARAVAGEPAAIKEWYVNTPAGLEHGFTVAAPSGVPLGERRAGEPLRLALALQSALRARAVAEGQAVEFVDAAGSVVLRYDKLAVWDACGQPLAARMSVKGEELRLEVEDAAATYPVTIDPNFSQQAYLKASNTGASDNFGISVAVAGDTVVVGANGEDSNATGVNGDQTNNSAGNAGAAYVFVRSGTTWTQQAYLKASNTEASDNFGTSVAVAGDTVVVGAIGEDSNATGVNGDQTNNSAGNAGAAYVFVRSGTIWTQQAYLKASNTEANDTFGLSVAVAGDTVVVGAFQEDSNATGVNGDQTNNSASSAGAAYVFVRSSTVWTQQAYLKASNTEANDQFGRSVAVTGDTVVVGANLEDSNATGVNGNQADNSATDSGAAYVFVRSGVTWSQQAYLKASNTGASDQFGTSVAVAGDTVVVGANAEDSNATGVNGNQADNSATDSGAAYVFVRSGVTWSQQAYLKASNTGANDQFGRSVAVAGDTVVVGAWLEDSNATGVNGNQADNSAAEAGAAYVFVRSGTTWSQQAYLKASNTEASDQFGFVVAVAGDTVVVGANLEDSNATGVNGNGADNSAADAGAAYVFFTPPIVVTTLADEQNTNGQCSLREALINANNNNQSGSMDCAAGGGTDTISFSVNGTINLTGALPAISSSLTITGPGANQLTVRRDTGGNYRIFQVNAGTTVSLAGLTITNGNDTFGGGINNAGNLTINECAITTNTATSNGGGVNNLGGTLTINQSTISGNTAGDGGGLFSQSPGMATLTNCTISGNTATSFTGGITILGNGGNATTATLSNCTVTNNTGPTEGGIVTIDNDGVSATTTTLKNNIIANNSAPNLARIGTNASVVSQGFNLASDNSVALLNQAATDQNNVNPLLGLLQNNGGPTATHALLTGSPALDKGNSFGVTTDQRGFPRPVDITTINPATGGDNADIGAFEAPDFKVTTIADTGAGSLRQAILDAAANGAGADTITFSALFNTPQTITLTSGELIINSNLTINGPGANLLTVSGNNASRVFTINFGITASLSGMTITGGNSGSVGGGIANSGTLMVSNSTISGNTAGGFGGGLYNNGTVLTVTNSTVSGNTTSTSGGGIHVDGGTVTVTNSTISGNTANGTGTGGGLANFGTLTLTNSTISGNRVPNGDGNGGGIWSGGFGFTTITIINSTITNNSAAGAASASGVFRGFGTATLRNSIVAANVNNATQPDVSGAFDAASAFNLIGNAGTATGFTPANQNQTGNGATPINPLLGPLANNGGTTPTHALLPGSLALDKGSFVAGVTTDQRGLARLVNITSIPMASGGNDSDIGAFEFQGQLLTVTKTADSGDGVCDADCSLREAIAAAAAGDGIAFAALFNTPQTINLQTALPTIISSLTINGPGANLLTVQRASNAATDFRIFNISIGITNGVALSGMTITGGRATGNFGGGIFSSSNLTLTNVHVTGNQAQNGGGVALFNADGLFTNCTLSGNTGTNQAGGINNQSSAGHTLRLVNSTFSGNISGGLGGGILTASTSGIGNLEVVNSTFANNTASTGGGILTLTSGAGTTAMTTLRNSILANNSPTNLAVLNSGATVTSQGFNLSDNYNGVLTLLGTDITSATPLLAPLSLNGGTTPTHALLAGSPALDKGHRSGSTTDQRGLARPFDISTILPATGGDNADIGAFETQALIVTNANDLGAGSLRQALTDANVNAEVNDILFDATFFNVSRTINLASALPSLTASVTINGPGANLLTVRRDTGGDYRVFTINSGTTVAISGMTVSNGHPASGLNGGALSNSGTLSLLNCIFSGNVATDAGSNTAFGGGVFSDGFLTVTGCQFTGNTARNGGGLAVNANLATLSNNTFSTNTALNGGGFYLLAGATVNASDCTANGNTATNNGGGVLNSGTLTLTKAALTGNSALIGGGMLSAGTATLTNATISGNTASNFPGGLANVSNPGQSATLTLTNCTITANSSSGTLTGGIFTQNSGTSATTQLKNTLVAANGGPNFGKAGFANETVSSQGFNLDSDGTSGFVNGVNNDLVGTVGSPINAALAPLGNNGGPTQTHALLLGSPALDTGQSTGITTDQRGLLRPVNLPGIPATTPGDSADIGAYEAQTAPLLPGVYINDVAVTEGNAGTATATFNVTLSATSAQTVTVQFATANGTATAGSDYVATSGTLTFNPGVTSQPINVTINGDTAAEAAETFFINLTNLVNVSIGDNQGVGTINNDDLLLVTNANDAGAGSLRQALLDANTNPLTNTIQFEPVFFSTARTINLASALPNIARSLTLAGPGANLLTVRRDTGGDYRIFTINFGTTVNLSQLTIANGKTPSGQFGGGIQNSGTLNLTQCVVTGNTATGAFGGGIGSSGALTISQSTISGNNAGNGGGLSQGGGTLTLTNSTVSGNTTVFQSGGVDLQDTVATLTNSTISGNTAGSYPGGIFNIASSGNSSSLTVTNCTIANNQSNGTVGGIVTLDSGGAISAVTQLKNVILANNTGPNLLKSGTNATVTSLGNNLSSDNGGGFLIGPGDLINSNPMLGALANYGGPTQTHALNTGSPAINAGTATGAPATDQRGVARPQGAAVDIGAFELIANPLVVTNTNDAGAGSLRQALLDANISVGTDNITFNLPAGPQIINLASALPDITGSVTLNGPGANLLTVRRNTGGDYRIFNIPGSGLNVTLSGLTISNGRVSGAGGGIASSSNLTLTNCLISGNEAVGDVGGGIYLSNANGTFTGSTFSGNTSVGRGGGISYEIGSAVNVTLTMTNCTVSGNTATGAGAGGGIFNLGFAGTNTLQVTNCTFANNIGSTADTGGIRTGAIGAGTTAATILRNTIIANSTGANLGAATASGGVATITSQGFNLTSDNGGGFLNQATDKINAFAGLAPLANNGGPTPTHALLLGSAALDAGDNTGSGVMTDQRGAGFLRTVNLPNANAGDGTDIGAFEAQTLPPPGILINDVTVAEGNAGTSTATFNVTLSAASTQTVTVQFATANGTATAGSDYVATSGTLTFNPGVTSQPVNVTINGDTVFEPGETFFVNLSNPVNAVLGDSQGLGTIQNDEPIIVTNANDAGVGSLRKALLDTNANAGADTIQFEPVFFSTARTINLAGALPDLTDSLTLNGPGANLLTVRRDTGGNYRIFTINSGTTVILSGLTMTNGNVDGGGIANFGTLTVSNCVITGNTTNGGGAGVFNSGTLTMTGCTISGNSATGGATGGLWNLGFSSTPATATLTNCTISGNSNTNASVAQTGGGIDNSSVDADATVNLINCTIANNTVPDNTNGGGLYSGRFGTGNANITLKNTIIAGNSNPQVRQDVGGTVTSLGNNLLSDISLTAAAGDLLNTNPLLAALANNGGPTQTHALPGGSPAINAGTSIGAPATDQRGVARPQGAAIDIGAFELLTNPLVVTNTNDAGAGSLRQALLDANISAGTDNITFNLPAGPQTINLTSALPDLIDNLTITGPGVTLLTVSGNNTSRVFFIGSGLTVSLSGMTITGGNGVGTFSGIGGGIYNEGTLTVANSTISGNTATDSGGGIYNEGTLTVTNSAITGNTATVSGGGILDVGTLTVTNSAITGNTANSATGFTSGGIDSGGTLTVTNSTLSGNSAPNGNNNGGGIWTVTTAIITNSTITNNSAVGAASASGVYRHDGTVTIRNSISAGNVNNSTIPDVVAIGNTGITSSGFNLIGNVGALGGAFNQTGDQTGTGAAPLNPLLAVLGAYGGPTQTHALLPGSPAINAGTNTGAPTTDQRGIMRPQQTTTDIGAFESRGFTLAVTSGNNQSAAPNAMFANPLVVTVSSAFSEPVEGGRVTFTPPGAGASATLTGNPATIQAKGQASVTATANATLGTYQVIAAANGNTGTVAFNLTNGTCPGITVNPTNPTLPNGRAGVAYSQTFTQMGSAGTITWSVSAGALPAGLTLTGAVLSGTPTVNGTFGFTIKATDTNACMGTQAYTLLLNPPCTAITVNPATLPNGFQGTAYAQTLTATGGTAPYTFAVTTGSLPGGLTLAGGGALTGTPTTPGTFTFTVTATDNTGCTGLRAYTVIVSGNGLMFYPLPRPIRLLDTRAGEGNCDSAGTPIVGGTSLTTQARVTCEGITLPPSAQAVVGNVTVINLTNQAGFMTLYPTGVPAPLAANMVYQPGQVLSNAFTVGLGANGAFDIFGQRTIDVVVDISGYYAPPGAANPGGLYFHPLPRPVRLLDTRAGEGNCDSVGTPIAAGASLTTQARISCEGLTIPAAAQAVVGNATVINLTNQAGFLTLYPNGVAVPLAANMVYQPGQVLSNAFTVSLNASGEFNIFGQRTIEMVVDVAGYYSSEASDTNGPGLLFSALPRPVRLLDTRAGEGNCDSVGTPIAAGTSLTTQARITCEGIPIPNTAQTVLGNVTVINLSNQAGFLTMYPNGVTAPLAANLVYQPNQILANAFVVSLSGGGEFNIFGQRLIEAIVDVSGYFAP